MEHNHEQSLGEIPVKQLFFHKAINFGISYPIDLRVICRVIFHQVKMSYFWFSNCHTNQPFFYWHFHRNKYECSQ